MTVCPFVHRSFTSASTSASVSFPHALFLRILPLCAHDRREAFEAGFGSVTPMISGQTRNIRYGMNGER